MTSKLPEPGLVPFVISVTGHRDLRPQDIDALRSEVAKVLDALQESMPSTPLVVLSALAEGADQLVAEVALERELTLAVVLPMPLEVYKTTMSEEAQGKLHTLIAAGAVQMVLPISDVTLASIATSEDARASCYEALGVFLARHGQVLIALWDGKHSTKLGGTARVVHKVRSGSEDEPADALESNCGVVYQVITPRLSSTDPARPVRTVTLGCERHRVSPRKDSADNEDEISRATFAQAEMNLERFNREAKRFLGSTSASRARLINDSAVTRSYFADVVEAFYSVGDAISVRANKQRRFFLTAIIATAVTGALFYGIHGEMLEYKTWPWFSFPIFVILAVVFHRIARTTYVETRYLDARALAEALRVQFFWEMAGLKEPVDKHFLSDRSGELNWIRFALRNIWLLYRGTDEGTFEPNCKAVLEKWVRDQQAWYHRKAVRQSHLVHEREKVSRTALVVAVAWSVLVPASILIPGPWKTMAPWKYSGEGHRHWEYQLLHIVLAVPTLLAAAYKLWIEQSGYEEQSREYRFMDRQFAAKAKELEVVLDTPEQAKNILLELGIESLGENGRWLLMHRERPLEVLSSP